LSNPLKVRGTGSILFLKNGLEKKIAKRKKNYKNHPRSNNFEVHVCTAVAHCFPNILNVMVLENINLSEDKIGRPPLWSNETKLDFYHQSDT
jgi:hypothetical protein